MKLLKGMMLPLAIVIMAACGADKQVSENVRAIKYVEVTEYAAGQQRTISGVVEASDKADLSFQISGNVATVDVTLGKQVKEGDQLASLDARPYELARNAAQAELTKAQAVYADRKNDYEAKAKLYEDRYVSKSVVDASYADYQSAEQNIEAAKAQLELAERDLKNTVLRAPFNGEIAKLNIDRANNVSAGMPVLQILGEGGLEVGLALPESLRRNVKVGMPVTVHFPSLRNVMSTGEVSEIASSTGDTNAFETKVSLEKTENLYPGLTADVTFSFTPAGETNAAFLVPATALAPADNPGEANVFVFDPETSTVHKRKIKARNIRDNHVEVSEGLVYGEIVATAGTHFLSDGQEVVLYQGK